MDEGTNIVMINSVGEVLLYLRDDKPTIKFPNTWCLPGGYVEDGEQPHECIRREIDEEMGVLLDEQAVRPLVSATRSYGVEHTFWTEVDLDLDFETNTSCNILHSSGSTGFPKPIRNIHKSFIYNAANNFGLRGFITLPLFHNHGMSSFYRALYAGKVLYFYNPNLPLTARQLTAVFTHLGSELEIFSFIPPEMLPRLKYLDDTDVIEGRQYGLDGPVTYYIAGDNGNGAVDSGENVYVYVGERSGGRDYYALEVTDRSAPRLARARTPRRLVVRCPVVDASRTSRREPAAPVRVRPVPRSSPAVAPFTVPSPATTRSARPRR